METFSTRLLVLILSGVSILCAADPILGTWTLNLHESRYYPGPAPKSQVRVYGTSDEGTMVTVTTVNAEDETVKTIFPGIYDGRDYPITGASEYDTIAMHRIDDYTAEATHKHAGMNIAISRRVVAPDGKTMTITVKSADPQRTSVDITSVYDRKE